MELKTLPSLRDKKRYIVFRLYTQGTIPINNIQNAIMHSVINWMGEAEAARGNVRVIKNLWDEKKRIGILRCGNKYVDEVKVALSLVYQVGDHRVTIASLFVTGTILSGKSKLKGLRLEDFEV